MNHDILVLRALVRLSRSRSHVCLDSLAVRTGGEISEVRASLVRLSAAGWVVRDQHTASLTLAGLAVGVAASKLRAKPRAAEKSSPVHQVPVSRRAA